MLSGACLLVMAGPVLADSLRTDTRFSLGYRQDSLDWSIADSDGSPNVLSELEWVDVDILQFRGELSGSNTERLYFRGSAAFGVAVDGENRDTDYAGDNRSLAFSRSVNGVDGSSTLDLSAAIGHTFAFGETGRHQFIPLLGYSWHRQQMQIVDGNQVLSNLANAKIYDPSTTTVPALGPFAGLDSSYDAQWFGLWLGGDVLWDLQKRGAAYARLEAHWVDYSAEADWNLRSDFAHPLSFEHQADGFGWVMELGWRQPLAAQAWVWGVSLSLQDWTTDAGIDRTYFASGSIADTRLNEVNWSSRTLNLSLGKTF